MSTLTERRLPLKLALSQSTAAQTRLAARDFETAKDDLFLKAGKPSCLGVLQAVGPRRYFHRSAEKSRSNTISTLVAGEEDIEVKTGKGLTSVSNDWDEELRVQTPTDIEDVSQLRTRLTTYSNFSAFQIRQPDSFSRFSLTQDMYDELCARFEIFGALGDTLMYMGLRERDVEVAPLRLRWQSLAEQVDAYDESGWECSYCFRYVEENHRGTERPWSLRQFAIYNKTELAAADRASWILVSVPDDVLADFKDVAARDHGPILDMSISAHASIIATAISYWRKYLVYLAERVDEHVGQLLFSYNPLTDIKQNDEVKFADPMHDHSIDFAANGTRLRLKNLDDDIADAILALEANRELISSLLCMWKCCRVAVGSEVEMFSIVSILTERTRDVDAFVRHLRTLRKKLTTCTQIVSSFSELANGMSLQANGDSLRNLALQAQVENERTLELTVQAGQDTAAVKALTVIALIFLPTTVVLVSRHSMKLCSANDDPELFLDVAG